jgi:hypothetical protein
VTDDHLSLDDVAELDEGLQPPERISALRAHLHGCIECQDRARAIQATRSTLAGLPAAPMPADVTRRLDAALADAAAESAAPSPIDTPPRLTALSGGADVIPAAGAVRRRRGNPSARALGTAAAVVLAVTAIVVGTVRHHPSSSESAGGSAAPSAETAGGGVIVSGGAQSNFTINSTGRTYRPTSLPGNVAGLVGRASSPTVPAPAPSPSATGGQGSGAGAPTGDAGGDAQHKAAQRHSPSPPSNSGQSAIGTARAPTLTDSAVAPARALRPLVKSRKQLLACAARTSGEASAVPLTVDFAWWSNPPTTHREPAVVFVFRSPKPGLVTVYVAPASCDGTFLTFQNVTLP